jgi:uncharacterized protein YndB with AHSA1/START domain
MSNVSLKIEFPVHCKPALLFNYLTDPVFLSQWFADKVTQNGEIWHFTWNGEVAEGKVTEKKINASIKFVLDYHEEGEFIQMQIVVDAITDEVELLITDFCEPGEEDDLQQLWEGSIERLHRAVGA